MSEENQIQHHADGLVARAKAILTDPVATWKTVATETDEPKSILTRYVMPLAAIGPVAGFIGNQLFPISVFGVTVKTSIVGGIVGMIFGYLLALAGVFIVAFVANLLSKSFDGKDDFNAAFRLVAYSMTAVWVVSIVNIFPALSLLVLLGGIYSLYLFYKGASPVMGVPEDKSLVYTIVVVIAAFVVNMILGAIVGSIMAMGMFTSAATASMGSVSGGGGDDVNIESPYGSIKVDEQSGKTTMTIEADGETMTIEVPNEE